jgi:hypothetical protein
VQQDSKERAAAGGGLVDPDETESTNFSQLRTLKTLGTRIGVNLDAVVDNVAGVESGDCHERTMEHEEQDGHKAPAVVVAEEEPKSGKKELKEWDLCRFCRHKVPKQTLREHFGKHLLILKAVSTLVTLKYQYQLAWSSARPHEPNQKTFSRHFLKNTSPKYRQKILPRKVISEQQMLLQYLSSPRLFLYSFVDLLRVEYLMNSTK